MKVGINNRSKCLLRRHFNLNIHRKYEKQTTVLLWAAYFGPLSLISGQRRLELSRGRGESGAGEMDNVFERNLLDNLVTQA